MDCGGVRALINRYIDGELGYVEIAEFQQHLDFCPDCALELRELGDLRGVLAAWGGIRLAPPMGFADRVMAAVEREPLPGLAAAARRSRRRGARAPRPRPRQDAAPGRPHDPRQERDRLGAGVAAVVIGLERRHGREESEVRVP